jgi:hypothetical protein
MDAENDKTLRRIRDQFTHEARQKNCRSFATVGIAREPDGAKSTVTGFFGTKGELLLAADTLLKVIIDDVSCPCPGCDAAKGAASKALEVLGLGGESLAPGGGRVH